MSDQAASQMVFDALEAAADGQATRAEELIITVGREADGPRLFGVCCAIASAGGQVLHQIYGDHAPDIERGGQWNLQEFVPGGLDETPAQAFALRFLTAYCNGQTDTALAHFQALHAGGVDEVGEGVIQLLGQVAGLFITAFVKQQQA